MDVELIKRMLDACYQAKRIRDMLPPLPKGVTSSYIQYLDVIQSLERNGIHVKISDISDALNLPRPGVTRSRRWRRVVICKRKPRRTTDASPTFPSPKRAGRSHRRMTPNTSARSPHL